MFSHQAVSNTLNKLFDNNNLLYLGQKNLFYHMLIKNADYNIISDDSQPFIGILHDDPLFFSQQVDRVHLEYHTNSLVFFHSEAPKVLKKEDKHILSKKLKDVIKVFFSSAIRDSWGLSKDNNSYSMGYGCEIITQTNKIKNIAVLNFSQNSIINTIFSYIKNAFPDAQLVDNIENIENLAQYKIIVCLDGLYDIIYCAALGCVVLSNQDIQNSLPSVFRIKNINDINAQLSEILSQDLSKLSSLSQHLISNNFGLESFHRSISNAFSLLKNRTYIYEA